MEANEILRRLKVVEYKLKEHKKNGSCSCSSFVIQYEGSCQCKYGHKLSVLETDHMNLLRELPGGLINKKITWQDQPTEDGYYWFKEKGWTNEIVFFDSIKKGKVKYIEGWDYLSSITGKWYGPITPPTED